MDTRYDNSFKIIIPVAGVDELRQYQKALINVLAKIEIAECTPAVKEDVKSLFKLLSYLLIDKNIKPASTSEDDHGAVK